MYIPVSPEMRLIMAKALYGRAWSRAQTVQLKLKRAPIGLAEDVAKELCLEYISALRELSRQSDNLVKALEGLLHE